MLSKRLFLSFTCCFATIVLSLICARPIQASPLPSAYWQGQEVLGGTCFDNDPCQVSGGAGVTSYAAGWFQNIDGTYVAGQPILLPPDLEVKTISGTMGAASVSFGILPSPGIDVIASVSPDILGNEEGDATANLQFVYYMEIAGAPGDVPVVVHGQGSRDWETLHNGAYMNVGPYTWDLNNASVTQIIQLSTNVVYEIGLHASAEVECGDNMCGPTASATAETIVDPYFSFDPGFDGSGYSFVFSDGVENGPSNVVPLPSTFALLAGGLTALGLVRWAVKRDLAARRS